jgi:formylglycine-generating enzyme required for sulfatase activity
MKPNYSQILVINKILSNFAVSLLFILAVQLCFPFAASAQESRQLKREETKNNPGNTTGPRIALVIGNAGYQNVSKLVNPLNDARDIAEGLKSLGFEVLLGEDMDVFAMRRIISEFGDKLDDAKGGMALFYYAGHGIQYNQENYLIPVEFKTLTKGNIDVDTIELQRVMGKIKDAKTDVNIVILDACRDNPFGGGSRDTGQGWAKTNAPRDTLVVYATSPGEVASDGEGKNGLFTAALLGQMKNGDELDVMFRKVKNDVYKASKGGQTTWSNSSVRGEYSLAIPVAGSAKTAEGPKNKPANAKIEQQAWEAIQNESDPNILRQFLKQYPDGENAPKARDRLEDLVWATAKIDWDNAKLQTFLGEFPQGKHAQDARDMQAELAWGAIKNSKDKTKYADFLIKYPEAKFAAEAKKEISMLGAVEGNAATDRKNVVGMNFKYIPPGQFWMGAGSAEMKDAMMLKRTSFLMDETPQHTVDIRNGFWLTTTEVTQEQWEFVMGNNPSTSKSSNCPKCPVETVSWNEAKAFIRKLNEKNDEFEYRLPSEAEWEYAARAETTTIFSFGNTLNATQANFDGELPYGENVKSMGRGKPVAAGSYSPNKFGLFDMNGNVAEWCEDVYTENFQGLPTDGTANASGDPKKRVLRGGSWATSGFSCRSASRGPQDADYRYSNIGFRVAARLKDGK